MTRIIALAATLITFTALAVGGSTALAADRPSFTDEVASRLGISPEKLRAAYKAAYDARIDAAVKAGRLTPAQAARLKAWFGKASTVVPRLGRAFGPGAGRGFFRGLPRRGGIDRIARPTPAATYLGMTPAQLRKELAAGRSLAQIASSKGKTVDGLVDAMVAPLKQRLDAWVADKKLTRERADQILARATEWTTKLVERVPPTRVTRAAR